MKKSKKNNKYVIYQTREGRKVKKKLSRSTKGLLISKEKNSRIFKTEKSPLKKSRKSSILKNKKIEKYITKDIEEENEIGKIYNLKENSKFKTDFEVESDYITTSPVKERLEEENFDTKQRDYTTSNNNQFITLEEGTRNLDENSTKHKISGVYEEDNYERDASFDSEEEDFFTQEDKHKNSFVNMSKLSSGKKKRKKAILDAEKYYKLSQNMPLLSDDSDPEERYFGSRMESGSSPRREMELVDSNRIRENILKTENIKTSYDSLAAKLSKMYNRDYETEKPKSRRDKYTVELEIPTTKEKIRLAPKALKARKRRFRIPNNIEKRIKRRNTKSPRRDSIEKKGRLTPKRLYNFKNSVEKEERVDVKVGLDMLHTKELLSYYKEVVNKGKKDFVSHHRQQNFVKKFEYI